MNTKQKLIASALKLFNEKGFENTSTTSICKDAGFSSGALFVHFKTKNDLLDYLYVSIKKRYFDFVFGNLDPSLKLLDKIREVLKRSFQYYLNNYQEYVFMKSFANSIHISRIAKEEIEFEMQEFLKLIDELKNNGIIIHEDNNLLISAISGIFYSLVEYLQQTGDEDIEKCIDLVLRTIKK
ncbi:TetR/AcrR family transcriptional regulator [Candidatus Gracilibacteria bacterium 28_42_T64]|nr:TetR/AcrR family transcriptional regulator [Candidatus Gracilibacteria bacterium 28_42_T64]